MSNAHHARRVFFFVIFLHVICLQAFSIDTTGAQDFKGVWQAQFQGKTFLTIKLNDSDGKLTGTVSHSQVQWDNSGELTRAEAQDGNDPIVDAQINGKTLHLTSKDGSSQETTEFEMELSGDGQADLHLIGLPADTPAVKPWKLMREQSGDVAMASAAQAKPAVEPSMKEKLAAAAKIWIAGQTGNTTPASDAATAAPAGSSVANATTALASLKLADTPLAADLCKGIDALPRRVNDQQDNLGDMVNFVIVGSQEQVQSALEASKWHLADTDSKEAALKAVLATYQKKDYLAMPMSRLLLFGRVQDFGYEQAEPYAVVASRHHFRLWKAPFTYDGKTVWVGAGTHDIGFEKDQRNGKVTHKIDPAVDGERDNIGRSLQEAGKTESLTYYLPPDPVQDAKNATGGGYHSDGRMLVIVLK